MSIHLAAPTTIPSEETWGELESGGDDNQKGDEVVEESRKMISQLNESRKNFWQVQMNDKEEKKENNKDHKMEKEMKRKDTIWSVKVKEERYSTEKSKKNKE